MQPLAPYQVSLAEGASLDELGVAVPAEPHLGGDRYVVRIAAGDVDRVRGLAGVTAVEPLPADARYVASRFTGDRVGVVIDLFAGATGSEKSAVADALRGWGATVTESAPDTLRAEIDPARLVELAAMPAVRWIEPGR